MTATARRPGTALRLLATATLALLALLATAPTAAAHARFVSSSPQPGAQLDSLPSTVTVEFSENVRAPAFVTVTGPGGESVASGEGEVLGAEVSKALQGGGPPGRYRLAYRVTSADGHPIEGTVAFEVTGAGSTAGGTPQDRTTTGGAEAGTGLGGGALALLLAVLVVGLVALGAGARQLVRRVSVPADQPPPGAQPYR